MFPTSSWAESSMGFSSWLSPHLFWIPDSFVITRTCRYALETVDFTKPYDLKLYCLFIYLLVIFFFIKTSKYPVLQNKGLSFSVYSTNFFFSDVKNELPRSSSYPCMSGRFAPWTEFVPLWLLNDWANVQWKERTQQAFCFVCVLASSAPRSDAALSYCFHRVTTRSQNQCYCLYKNMLLLPEWVNHCG